MLVSCGSDSPDDGADAAETTAAGADTDAVEATGAPVTVAATVDSAPAAPATAASGDFCATVPSAADIETAIGVAVTSPLASGQAATAPTCSYLRAADDFPAISFHVVYGQTIAQQIEYVKNTFSIDITPMADEPGFYLGEGNSVYYESDGNLYQTQATIDESGPGQAAVLLMRIWLDV